MKLVAENCRIVILTLGRRPAHTSTFDSDDDDHMPVFESKPLTTPKWQAVANKTFARNPLIFGIPFVLIMVGASFAMTPFAQTRYDLHDQQVKVASTPFLPPSAYYIFLQVTKEQELGLSKNRKKFDIREEYYVSGCWIRGICVSNDHIVASERRGRRRMGAEENTAAQGSPRMGRTAHRATGQEDMIQFLLARRQPLDIPSAYVFVQEFICFSLRMRSKPLLRGYTSLVWDYIDSTNEDKRYGLPDPSLTDPRDKFFECRSFLAEERYGCPSMAYAHRCLAFEVYYPFLIFDILSICSRLQDILPSSCHGCVTILVRRDRRKLDRKVSPTMASLLIPRPHCEEATDPWELISIIHPNHDCPFLSLGRRHKVIENGQEQLGILHWFVLDACLVVAGRGFLSSTLDRSGRISTEENGLLTGRKYWFFLDDDVDDYDICTDFMEWTPLPRKEVPERWLVIDQHEKSIPNPLQEESFSDISSCITQKDRICALSGVNEEIQAVHLIPQVYAAWVRYFLFLRLHTVSSSLRSITATRSSCSSADSHLLLQPPNPVLSMISAKSSPSNPVCEIP